MAITTAKFNIYKQHIERLNNLGVTSINAEYICPFCKEPFTSNQLEELSEEHAPQNALGGAKIAVTCKKCNNGYGGNIDSDLKTFVLRHEFNKGIPNAEVEYELAPGLHGSLYHNEKGDVQFKINTKKCDPKKSEPFIEVTGDGTILNGKIKLPSKYNAPSASAGLYKSAYIILFKYTGYNFLLNDHYQPLRDQIENPDDTFPRLYSAQAPIGISDGVYFCNAEDFKGFFVVLTLEVKAKNRFMVLFPTPSYSFEQTVEFCKSLGPEKPIQCLTLPNDCIGNDSDIKRLQEMINS